MRLAPSSLGFFQTFWMLYNILSVNIMFLPTHVAFLVRSYHIVSNNNVHVFSELCWFLRCSSGWNPSWDAWSPAGKRNTRWPYCSSTLSLWDALPYTHEVRSLLNPDLSRETEIFTLRNESQIQLLDLQAFPNPNSRSIWRICRGITVTARRMDTPSMRPPSSEAASFKIRDATSKTEPWLVQIDSHAVLLSMNMHLLYFHFNQDSPPPPPPPGFLWTKVSLAFFHHRNVELAVSDGKVWFYVSHLYIFVLLTLSWCIKKQYLIIVRSCNYIYPILYLLMSFIKTQTTVQNP